MNAAKKRPEGVLRGVATQAQPRQLPRAPRQAAAAPAGSPAGVALARQPASAFDAGYEQGLEQGRAAGLQQGLQGAQQRIDDAMRTARQEFEQVANQRLQDFKAEAGTRLVRLERVLAAFESAATRRIGELESDAVALAFGALCKLLSEQAGHAPVIAGIVQQALAQLRGSTLLAVRLNERDLRTLMDDEQGHRLQAAAPQVRWIADAAVGAGGCLVDTTAGSLDARLGTQLAALRTLWSAVPDSMDRPA
ncbi:MAG TPA: FliH/SctL family protein [Burkholderiaceae bacterium]